MKFTAILLLATFLSASARSGAQTVTLSKKDAPLQSVLKEVEAQTGYQFFYKTSLELKFSPVTVDFNSLPLRDALDAIFKSQSINYKIIDKTITLIEVETDADANNLAESLIDVKGRVVDDLGNALIATVQVKGTNKVVSTNSSGDFSLLAIDPNAVIIITSLSSETLEIKINSRPELGIIKLTPKIAQLDELVIQGYYNTSKKLSTSSTGKVTAEEISKMPVENPLLALHGRIPGVNIIQSSGVPGATVQIQIRGRNSLVQGSDPLFIIDGVPFAPNNSNINSLLSQISGAPGMGLSPLNSINPDDIESIDILKDADATAIYGSRGANGVVLITTKKGKTGKTIITANLSYGVSDIQKSMPFLTTSEYNAMREEAFANDGLTPSTVSSSPAYAPDLLLWDNYRYTNIFGLLTGGTASFSNAQVSISGGSNTTTFFASGSHNVQTTVMPQSLSDKRSSFNFNGTHTNPSKSFNINLSANYSFDLNKSSNSGSLFYNTLPPNVPDLLTASGDLNWQDKGVSFINPLAFLRQPYVAKIENLTSQLQLTNHLLKNLTLKNSLGYNRMNVSETSINPLSAQNPNANPQRTSSFAERVFRSWVFEPQLDYSARIGKIKVLATLGSTFQSSTDNGLSMTASGYTSDALMYSLSAASNITSRSNSDNRYKYAAVFGRVNLNHANRYIVNITGRRDGSSRFGDDQKLANFASVGAAWLFSNEWFSRNLQWLSFGKLRTSYGTSGNDQIGNYRYLDAWGTTDPYQNTSTLVPSNLSNPSYAWEVNRKFEAALELELFKQRLDFSISYYLNRSDNQLVDYRLPSQTGFFSIFRNFPAVVENRGLEMQLGVNIIKNRNIEWRTSVNVTIPKNILKRFDGIESSSYRNVYKVGSSLSILNLLSSSGVDPVTGLFTFNDLDGNGVISLPGDAVNAGNTDPKFFGGVSNMIKVGNWDVSCFLDFKNQRGRTLLYDIYSNNLTPGLMNNFPSVVLDRWSKPGDVSRIQRYTAITTSTAFQAARNFAQSDGVIGDASYLRLKNVTVSYTVNQKLLGKIKGSAAKLFLSVQNLFTITNYEGWDPETQNLFTLPPLRTTTFGIQFSF